LAELLVHGHASAPASSDAALLHREDEGLPEREMRGA